MPVDQTGRSWSFSQGGWIGNQDKQTSSTSDFEVAAVPGLNASSSQSANTPSYTVYLAWIGVLFLLLVIAKFVQDHDKSGIEPKMTGVNVHNLIVDTGLVAFGFIALKIVVNKYLSGVKPLADLVNML
jgi:hypothetical protein